MEEDRFPLAVALAKIERSPKRTKHEILQGFQLLKRIINKYTSCIHFSTYSLITYPGDEKYRVFRKENEALSKTLYILEGVHPFLKMIGFEDVKF
jgi:hypothetical protein